MKTTVVGEVVARASCAGRVMVTVSEPAEKEGERRNCWSSGLPKTSSRML